MLTMNFSYFSFKKVAFIKMSNLIQFMLFLPLAVLLQA